MAASLAQPAVNTQMAVDPIDITIAIIIDI
jgi:hypothetical protein